MSWLNMTCGTNPIPDPNPNPDPNPKPSFQQPPLLPFLACPSACGPQSLAAEAALDKIRYDRDVLLYVSKEHERATAAGQARREKFASQREDADNQQAGSGQVRPGAWLARLFFQLVLLWGLSQYRGCFSDKRFEISVLISL